MIKKQKYNLAIILLTCLIMLGNIAYAQTTDTTVPSVPTNLLASLSTTPGQISISWTASTDNVGVAGYYIYRNGTLIANTSGTLFTDITSPGGYTYSITAYDAAGNISSQSGSTTPIFIIAEPHLLPPQLGFI